VRVGFFTAVERSELDPDLMCSPCGDRGHSPPEALLATPRDRRSLQQPADRWREMLDGPEEPCEHDSGDISYLPEPDEGADLPPVVQHDGVAEGPLRDAWRRITNGVATAYSWWHQQQGEPEAPLAARDVTLLPDDQGGGQDKIPPRDVEGLQSDGVRPGGRGTRVPDMAAASMDLKYSFQTPERLCVTPPRITLAVGWMQRTTLARTFAVSQPLPFLYLPRLVGAQYSSDSIADGHWPPVTAVRKSVRRLRNELARHALRNPTAQIGMTTMVIELDIRELIPELLRFMRALPEEQAFLVEALRAWWQHMDPLAVTLTVVPPPLPSGGSHYGQTNPDGLCGGHALYQALMRWRSRMSMNRDCEATRATYRTLFADWLQRLTDESNWPGLAHHDRESYTNVLGAWLCEFDCKDTRNPTRVSSAHWFPMSMVQLLGYESGMRTWRMTEGSESARPAYQYISADGTDLSQRKCRLSSLIELASPDGDSPLQHFGYSAHHYYPVLYQYHRWSRGIWIRRGKP
jgi:hypothetical protein